jgi:hypothetical protein
MGKGREFVRMHAYSPAMLGTIMRPDEEQPSIHQPKAWAADSRRRKECDRAKTTGNTIPATRMNHNKVPVGWISINALERRRSNKCA